MLAGSGGFEDVQSAVQRGTGSGWLEAFTKSAVAAQDWGSAWGTDAGQHLADAFLTSIRDVSILDAIAAHAVAVDPRATQAQILSGASADVVTQGAPKVATRVSLNPQSLTRKKVAAIVAMTNELARLPEAQRIIQQELRTQVSTITNAAFLGVLTATTATKGATPTATVQAALDALEDCTQAVIAAPYGFVRQLAAESNGRIGLTGGTIFPGCQIIATTATVGSLYAIAADRIVLHHEPLRMVPATNASVQLDDAPTGGAPSLISLWQNGMRAVLVEREFQACGKCIEVALS